MDDMEEPVLINQLPKSWLYWNNDTQGTVVKTRIGRTTLWDAIATSRKILDEDGHSPFVVSF